MMSLLQLRVQVRVQLWVDNVDLRINFQLIDRLVYLNMSLLWLRFRLLLQVGGLDNLDI